ncbi:MAG: hypothetical protein ACRD3W_26675 [Terriglobales bacterium]
MTSASATTTGAVLNEIARLAIAAGARQVASGFAAEPPSGASPCFRERNRSQSEQSGELYQLNCETANYFFLCCIYCQQSIFQWRTAMMHQALETFFFVQVSFEHALNRLRDGGDALVCEYITTPWKRAAAKFVADMGGTTNLHSELESIREDLRILSSEVRELQKTAVKV